MQTGTYDPRGESANSKVNDDWGEAVSSAALNSTNPGAIVGRPHGVDVEGALARHIMCHPCPVQRLGHTPIGQDQVLCFPSLGDQHLQLLTNFKLKPQITE